MTQKFKKGDRVRYIEETNSVLVKNNVYVVSGRYRNGGGVHLEGIPGQYMWWYDYRFEPATDLPKFDLTKALFTAEGTPVEIITTTGRDKKYPVLAYEGKAKLPSKFTLEGVSKSGEARRNLTNVQVVEEPTEAKEEAVEEVVLYANLYDDGDRGLRQLDLGNELYESVDAATESYKEGRIESKKHPKRIGVAKVTLVKGKLPSRFNKKGV